MAWAIIIAALAAGQPAPASASDKASPAPSEAPEAAQRDYSSEPVPIVVSGKAEGSQKIVFVGSRIRRTSLFADGQAASSTSLNGLVPTSGMDPTSGFTRTISRTECRADEEGIGETAACLLHAATTDLAAGQRDTAIALLRHLATDPQFSGVEHLAAARALHGEAERTGDDPLRLHAIDLSLDTGLLEGAEAHSAHRTIVAIALRLGRSDRAIEELELMEASGAANATDMANLAILQRQQKSPAASATMQRAIALMEAGGRSVPAGWSDFVEAGVHIP
jgi:hypothetical protein